ncbi:MAG: hypothetical protein H0U22_04180, partial [Geodermatophilaceae bacterium]|nr:hypothetical protein [Geodermatophilaceae bacterium]
MAEDPGEAPSPPTGNYDVKPVKMPDAPDWRPLTITEHYQMLSQLRDQAARASAEMWGNAAAQMESTRNNLRGYGHSLSQDWRSQAAEPFFEYVEGTNTSLDRWAQAARTNQIRLNRLADAIETAQTQMETLYASFKANVASIDENEFGAGWMGDEDEDDMAEEVRQKTEESRRIMQTLSDVYNGTALDIDSKFQGPADARKPTAAEMARALGGPPGRASAPGAPPGGVGGAPRGAPPGAPGSPGGHTAMVMGPSVGSLGPQPAAPKGPAPVAPRAPAPAAAPVAPAALGPVGPAPTAPTLPAGGMT